MAESGDYIQKQMARDREYAESFQSPEYLRWVEGLSLEAHQKAESLGLLKPMIDRSGSTSRDEDISSLAVEAPGVLPLDDVSESEISKSTRTPDTDERLWDALRRLLGELLNQKNAALSIECLAVVSGIGFLGDSMTEIARRNGVTRAAVSKRCVELTQKLKLNPSRAMRSLTARISYARTQHILHRNYEQRNRENR